MDVKTSIIENGKVVVLQGSEVAQTFDPALLPSEVRQALVTVAVQRIFRERTAGKVDAAEDRKKAAENCAAQWKAWLNGDLAIERASKVELTDAEILAATANFIVTRKQLAGDKREASEIIAAWNKLDAKKREAVLEALKKPLKKHLAEQLKIKRGKGDKIDW